MSEQPLVSVLMPTYNGEAFVRESIESVLAQTYDRVELLVVDDCSSDATAEIVAEYAAREPGRVRLSRKQDRAGPCRRRNDALEMAQGTLIAWLDQDDVWLPTKTERQVAVFEAEQDVGLVYTGYEAFDSATSESIPWRDESIEVDGYPLRGLFVEGCFIASLTTMFRREVLTRRKLRLRDTDFSFGDDYFLWLVLALDWRVVRIDETLARYRRHSENESTRVGETNYHLARVGLLEEFLESFPEARAPLGRWRRVGLARHYLSAAQFEGARGRRLQAAKYGAASLRRSPAGFARGLIRMSRWSSRLSPPPAKSRQG
jgi:teichuronic acid biosynthesis glycosyltransferase TuaG